MECDFSVNEEMAVKNMTESTFSAKRMVCVHIHSVGGINIIDVHNKQLPLYCAMLDTDIQPTWKIRKVQDQGLLQIRREKL